MTDIIRREQPQDRAWLDLMLPAAELAKSVAETDFVPKALRGKPAAIAAAILYGDEVGIGPMQALAKIHVIEGKPALSAETQRALILAAGHELWIDEATNTRVTWVGRRAGSDNTTRITWTMDDAKRANLSGRGPWRSYPRAMLSARASSELARAMFADVIGGLGSIEEFEDGWVDTSATDTTDNGDAPPVAKSRNTRKRVARGSSPSPKVGGGAPEPKAIDAGSTANDLPPLPGDETFEEQTGQDARLPDGWPGVAAACREAGLNDDGRHALALIASGGRVSSSRELTGTEAASARAWATRIKRGELHLVLDDPPRLVETETARTVEEAPRQQQEGDSDASPDTPGMHEALPVELLTGTAAWVGFAQGRRTQTGMLKKARALANDDGIDLPPTLDEVPEQIRADLAAWIEEGTA